MTLKVQRRQCETCIFRAEFWPPERLAELLEEISDPRMSGHFTSHRICHHSRDAVCAGFWARHRNDFDLGQLAQRLGWIRYVDDDEEERL